MFAYCNNNPVTSADHSGEKLSESVLLTDSGKMPDPLRTKVKECEARIAAMDKYNEKTVMVYDYAEVVGSSVLNSGVCITFSFDKNNQNNSNIRIWNSNKVTDKNEMMAIIHVMMHNKYFDKTIWTNTAQQFYNEWKGHNDFYLIGVKRNKTEHVDFTAGDGYNSIWDFFAD